MHAVYGVWCEERQSKSSNNRELINLMEVEACRMEGMELFFLTDNSVAEAVYYWVNCSDKDVFDLIIWLV